jgi:alpha-L-fucosidase
VLNLPPVTRPFTRAKQWSAGEVPRVEYDKEFETAYDVAALTRKPAPGKAAIEAFFTAKGPHVFAILPRWPGRRFTVKDLGSAPVKSVRLLGTDARLRYTAGAGSLTVELPELPEDLLRQPAWVLEIHR